MSEKVINGYLKKISPQDPLRELFEKHVLPSLRYPKEEEGATEKPRGPRYSCALCMLDEKKIHVTFANFYVYLRHLGEKHKKQLPCDGNIFNTASIEHKCNLCEKSFTRKEHYQTHLLSSAHRERENEVYGADKSPSPSLSSMQQQQQQQQQQQSSKSQLKQLKNQKQPPPPPPPPPPPFEDEDSGGVKVNASKAAASSSAASKLHEKKQENDDEDVCANAFLEGYNPYKICELDSGISGTKWSIRACLSKIGIIRDYYNEYGSGKTMRLQFYEETGYIELVFFGNYCYFWAQNNLEVKTVYTIRGATIKLSKSSKGLIKSWHNKANSIYDLHYNGRLTTITRDRDQTPIEQKFLIKIDKNAAAAAAANNQRQPTTTTSTTTTDTHDRHEQQKPNQQQHKHLKPEFIINTTAAKYSEDQKLNSKTAYSFEKSKKRKQKCLEDDDYDADIDESDNEKENAQPPPTAAGEYSGFRKENKRQKFK